MASDKRGRWFVRLLDWAGRVDSFFALPRSIKNLALVATVGLVVVTVALFWAFQNPWYGVFSAPAALLGGAYVSHERTLRRLTPVPSDRVDDIHPVNTAAERIEALAKQGQQLSERIASGAGSQDFSMTQSRVTKHREAAKDLLDEVSPEHVDVFLHWDAGQGPNGAGMTVEGMRPAWVFELRRADEALTGIATRLRALAGEDVGPVTAKKVMVKEWLRKAWAEAGGLRQQSASDAEFEELDAEVTRLIRFALAPADADRVLDRSGYDPERFSDLQLGAGGVKVWYTTILMCISLQSRLDTMDLADSFDPRDWHGRWL